MNMKTKVWQENLRMTWGIDENCDDKGGKIMNIDEKIWKENYQEQQEEE